MNSFESSIYGRNHLVHSDNDNHVFRAITEVAYPVSVSVNIHKLAICGKSVGAHQVVIG